MSKGILKQIFKDHWSEFVRRYKSRIRENVFSEVEKMMNCGDIKNGYIEFRCDKCGSTKKVGFRCRSRFCTSCGKVYVDNWVEDMVSRLINAKHRHMVFTIPKELRIYFQKDRELLKTLPESAAEVIKEWYKNRNKKQEYTPGIVTVIHTFGRDLKWNPHVHVIVTDGGIGNDGIWKPTKYIPYELMRKAWQKVLLDNMGIKIKKDKKEFKKLKNELYKKQDNGFYVYAKGEINTAQAAAKYVGRYTGRPAIAESRILKYDGKKVRFYYERHEDGKKIEEEIDALEFIARVIVHIPEKHFKMVRYYGIYARNNKHKNKKLFKFINEKVMEELKKLRKWEYRIMKSFGIDPLKCEKCGAQMKFYDIVYGGFSIRDKLKEEIHDEVKEKIDELMYQYGLIKGITHGKIEPLFV